MNIWNREMETLEGAALEAIQFERLKETLARIWKAGTPYRARMEDAGVSPESIRSLDDLEKLPMSRKMDFRENYPLGMLAVPLDAVVRLHASSGTTGSRTIVGYTAGDLRRSPSRTGCSRAASDFTTASKTWAPRSSPLPAAIPSSSSR